MRAAAEKALELDPLLAEAHDALAITYARDAQWARSEKSFRRAIELDPNRSESRRDFAIFLLWPLGRTEEALEQLALPRRADPLSSAIQESLAYMLPSAGRYDEAARHSEKIPADSPARSSCLGRAGCGREELLRQFRSSKQHSIGECRPAPRFGPFSAMFMRGPAAGTRRRKWLAVQTPSTKR